MSATVGIITAMVAERDLSAPSAAAGDTRPFHGGADLCVDAVDACVVEARRARVTRP